MKKITLLILLFYTVTLYAEPKSGIEFKEQSWAEALANAKSTHRLLFVDVFTEWCGPCKVMDRDVFTIPEVAKLYNDNFINFKLDAEKGIGPELRKKYGVASYPTYLFVDGDGTLIYSMDGSMPAADFMRHAHNAVSEATQEQNITQLAALYLNHKNDKDYLYNYLKRLTKLKLPTADLLDHYVSLLSPTEQSDPKTIRLITDNGVWLNRKLQLGPALTVLENNEAAFNSLQANEPRKESLQQIKRNAMGVSLQKAITDKNKSLLDQISALKESSQIDPFDNKETLAMKYYFAVKDYPKYKIRAFNYIDQVVLKIPADTLSKHDDEVYASMRSNPAAETYKHTQSIQVSNTIIRTTEDMLNVKLNKKDLSHLKSWTNEALRITELDPVYYKNVIPYYLNINAQVLYKLEEKQNAINQMKAALQLVADNPYAVKKLNEVLIKMEANEII